MRRPITSRKTFMRGSKKDKAYLCFLDQLLSFAKDEFRQVTIDYKSLQYSLVRNLLWVATVVFTVGASLFFWSLDVEQSPLRTVIPNFVPQATVVYGASLLLTLFAFVFCLDNLRGRRADNQFFDRAYSELAGLYASSGERAAKEHMVRQIEDGIIARVGDISRRGRRCRLATGLLMVACVCCALGFAIQLCMGRAC